MKVLPDIPEESNLTYPTSSVSKDKPKPCRDESNLMYPTSSVSKNKPKPCRDESNLMYPTSSVSKNKPVPCRDETRIKPGLATDVLNTVRKRKPCSDESKSINSSKKSKLSETTEKNDLEVSNFYLITKQ